MKLLVVFFGLVAAAASEVEFPPIFKDYHEEIGIPAARRTKLLEESIDFDGSRITGGTPAALGAHPHLGGLVITLTSGQTSVCGCSLLSNTRAVTAAHCWRHGNNQASLFTAVFGSTLLFSGGQRIPSNNVVVHPNYSTLTLNSDVAVIRFTHVPFSTAISGIALATGSNTFAGVWAQAAGFGTTGHNHPITQAQGKNQANLQVITNAVCAQTFGIFVISSSTICVSTANGQSTCPGDSGGPLSVGTGNNRQLIGITSFGHVAGCQAGHPAGFARVTSFATWINNQ